MLTQGTDRPATTPLRMESLSIAGSREGLAAALTRFVGDPARVRSLHEVLGPFCHESRNLLNILKMSLYLAQRHEGRSCADVWREVERSYREVEHLYDRLQMICRPMPLSLVRMPLLLLLDDRREAWVETFAAHGRHLELTAPTASDVGDYDPHNLGQALDAFVAWRAETGEEGQPAHLRGWTAEGVFHLEWAEAGPDSGAGAVPAFEGPGAMALPLLGRVIAAHGGSMELGSPEGQLVRLSWPQVARCPQ